MHATTVRETDEGWPLPNLCFRNSNHTLHHSHDNFHDLFVHLNPQDLLRQSQEPSSTTTSTSSSTTTLSRGLPRTGLLRASQICMFAHHGVEESKDFYCSFGFLLKEDLPSASVLMCSFQLDFGPGSLIPYTSSEAAGAKRPASHQKS